jgi:thiol-disulfide isomerase/thioredoxin
MRKHIIIPLTIAALALGAISVLAQDDASPAAAFEALSRELQALNQKAMRERTIEGKLATVADMEQRLQKFRESYPGTPEAWEATFQFGMLRHSTATLTQDPSAYRDAARILNEFIAYGGAARDKVAYAHYYLAEAFKGMGKYDDAEAEYKAVLSGFADVDPKLTQFTRMNLDDLDTQRRLAVGSEPIGFEVTSVNGQTLSPQKYKGKVLLIDFWATWCGPCKVDMPHVMKVYQKYNKKGFEIVGINLDRSRQAFDTYLAQNSIPWPQYFDGKYWNNDVATQYGVKAIPATYLIDKKGKIRYKALRGHQLEKAVATLIAEEG